MAKQLVNPIERHIEKAVVAVAGLLLIGGGARYLVTSPNQLEIGGENVVAGTIDQKLAQKAESVRERIRRAQPEIEMPEPLYDEFIAQLDPFAREKLPLLVAGTVSVGPEVPIIDPPEAVTGQAELVKVVPLSTPVAAHGRSTFLSYRADDSEVYDVANWVTVSATFDVKKQMAEQRREYTATRKDVFFAATQLQRRVRRADGSWSDSDWEDILPWPASEMPPEPIIRVTEQEGEVKVPVADLRNLEKFQKDLRAPAFQLELLRPLPPEIANGDRWTFPILTTRREVLQQDDQYLFPEDAPATEPVDRYSSGDEEDSPLLVGTVLSAAEATAAAFTEGGRLLRSAKANSSENDALRAYNVFFEITQDPESGASDKKRATRLMEEADLLRDDIVRIIRKGRGRQWKQTGGEEDKPKREPRPIQQLWAHDAAPGSVRSGETYQYRLRPAIYNRLAGQPDKFRPDRNADATVVVIAGVWSESAEVTIEPDIAFFVTAEVKRKQQVAVEFYMWFEGVWVKDRKKFSVGDTLRTRSRKEVPSEDGLGVERPNVEFVADAVVIDIDLERPYRERKKGKSRSGVTFAASGGACSVVFANAEGRLFERYVLTDKDSPDRKVFRDQLYKASKKTD